MERKIDIVGGARLAASLVAASCLLTGCLTQGGDPGGSTSTSQEAGGSPTENDAMVGRWVGQRQVLLISRSQDRYLVEAITPTPDLGVPSRHFNYTAEPTDDGLLIEMPTGPALMHYDPTNDSFNFNGLQFSRENLDPDWPGSALIGIWNSASPCNLQLSGFRRLSFELGNKLRVDNSNLTFNADEQGLVTFSEGGQEYRFQYEVSTGVLTLTDAIPATGGDRTRDEHCQFIL